MNDTHNDTLSLSRRCFSNSQPALLLLVPALSCLPYLLQPERTQMKHVASKPYLFRYTSRCNYLCQRIAIHRQVLERSPVPGRIHFRHSFASVRHGSAKNPVPTFMQEYRSSASISQLYSALAAQHLIDTSKIDEAHLLPPYSGAVQAFRTAPGSGYGSHHPYPGGLASHVSTNMHITNYICQTYTEVFLYHVNRDIAMAGQALHDIAKPFVFQWQKDGSSLKEYTIAGQGAHHTISLAEVIYRDFPPEEVIAQACAHGAPTSKQDEADVVGWLKAASLIAGKDPIAYGLLNRNGDGLPTPHHQEGYIVHLGDHDWVLSSPAAQKSVRLLKKIAVQNTI